MMDLRFNFRLLLASAALSVTAAAQSGSPMPPAVAAVAGSSFPDGTNSAAGAGAGASGAAANVPSNSPSDLNMRPQGAVQRIGPDDLLQVAVADLPELNRNFRVSADGNLSLPMLSEKIPVSGKFTTDVEKEISDALVNEQILVRPVVSVSIAEYRSAPVTVLGSVRHPVSFQAFGDIRLLDAITRADGLTDQAGPEILITRTNNSPAWDNGPLIQRIPVKGLIDQADPTYNIRLYGGEEIRVPEAGRVYVLGNVRKAGVFPINDNGDVTVLKVISECEGLLPYASKKSFIYRKEYGQETRTEIPVDVPDILKRKTPDIKLQANDILYIPDEKGKRMTVQTLEKAATFGIGTMSGYLIWH